MYSYFAIKALILDKSSSLTLLTSLSPSITIILLLIGKWSDINIEPSLLLFKFSNFLFGNG